MEWSALKKNCYRKNCSAVDLILTSRMIFRFEITIKRLYVSGAGGGGGEEQEIRVHLITCISGHIWKNLNNVVQGVNVTQRKLKKRIFTSSNTSTLAWNLRSSWTTSNIPFCEAIISEDAPRWRKIHIIRTSTRAEGYELRIRLTIIGDMSRKMM